MQRDSTGPVQCVEWERFTLRENQTATMIWRFAIFAALLILTVEAKKYTEASAAQRDEWQQFEEFLKWKKFRELRENYSQDAKYEKEHRESHDVDRIYERNQEVPISDPPPINEAALMARYIVNQAGMHNALMV